MTSNNKKKNLWKYISSVKVVIMLNLYNKSFPTLYSMVYNTSHTIQYFTMFGKFMYNQYLNTVFSENPVQAQQNVIKCQILQNFAMEQ